MILRIIHCPFCSSLASEVDGIAVCRGCCNVFEELERINERALFPKEVQLLAYMLLQKDGASSDELVEHLYGMREDGGPENPEFCIRSGCHRISKRTRGRLRVTSRYEVRDNSHIAYGRRYLKRGPFREEPVTAGFLTEKSQKNPVSA